MKTCKQCGRNLDDSCFRQYKSRSKGIYTSSKEPGRNTICRECESLNQMACRLLKAMDAGQPYNAEQLDKLRKFYQIQADLGRVPVTAAARRLIGLEPIDRFANTGASLMLKYHELYFHIDKVRERSYATFDEADEVHRRLTPRLKEAGLYEDVNNMMDDWYMDL